MMFPLTIQPENNEVLQVAHSLAFSKPIFLTDYKADIGLPKGTALVADGLLPFCMGNEPFDGFMVVTIPRKLAELVSTQWQAVENNIGNGFGLHPEFHKLAIQAVNTELPLAFKRYIFPCENIVTEKSPWSDRAASVFAPRVISNLGQLRKGSASKYVELCRDSNGQNYLVVHAGVGNMAPLYLSFAQALV